MVHEAMVLEYSGRHLAMIEAAAALKMVLYFSLLSCLFFPFGMVTTERSLPGLTIAIAAYLAKLMVLAVLLPVGETVVAKMRVFRYPVYSGWRVRGRRARRLPLVRFAELLMSSIHFDIAHMLAGGMLTLSLLLLYQDRISATLNVFAMQAIVLSMAVAWQAYIQDAPHLMVTALVASGGKGLSFRSRCIGSSGGSTYIARSSRLIGGGPTLLAGLFLIALSIFLVMPVGEGTRSLASPLAREDLAFSLAVILLGLLMMITRRNAVTQVVGFMSLENGIGACGERSQGHAAGGRVFGRIFDSDRLYRVRRLHFPYS